MDAIRIQKVDEKDGEIQMKGLPFKKGQHIEMSLLVEPTEAPTHLTSEQLSSTRLIGLWKDRKDIGEAEYCHPFAQSDGSQPQRRKSAEGGAREMAVCEHGHRDFR